MRVWFLLDKEKAIMSLHSDWAERAKKRVVVTWDHLVRTKIQILGQDHLVGHILLNRGILVLVAVTHDVI